MEKDKLKKNNAYTQLTACTGNCVYANRALKHASRR